jgi:transcriptional regulator with XRE-family HTH domain
MSNNRDEKALQEFGRNLKRLREAKGMSTREFADMAEIAYSQVWTLESGSGDPSLSTLLAISRTLDVTLDALITPSKQ